MIPTPWVAVVLALAVFRVTRLLGWDDLPPIYRLRSKVVGETIRYNDTESRGPIYAYKRATLAHFIACAYCLGFWVSAAVYVLWLFFPTGTLYGAAAFALSGAVGIVARRLDP